MTPKASILQRCQNRGQRCYTFVLSVAASISFKTCSQTPL